MKKAKVLRTSVLRVKGDAMTSILWFDEIGMGDVSQVGGKNASLGEMVSHLTTSGVRVPRGFATGMGGRV